MTRKRKRKITLIDTPKSRAKREREWALKGLIAGSAAASAIAFFLFVWYFPVVAGFIALGLVPLAVVAIFIFGLSRDVDFNGELRSGDAGKAATRVGMGVAA